MRAVVASYPALLPDFVVPVALMFSSDKVTVDCKGNRGLYPAYAAHVSRRRLGAATHLG